MNVTQTKQLIEPYVDLQLECDGLTKVLTYILTKNKVEHKIMMGTIANTIHFWIELSSGEIIDYRARMWMGENADVPHGIFKKEDYPKADWYEESYEVEIKTSDLIFHVLTMKK